MSAIPGTVVGGPIVPGDTGDTYSTLDPTYQQGGLRTVADHTARDAISVARRQEGMLVYTQNDGKYWELGSDLTTWTEFTSGGGGITGPGSSTDNAIVTWDGTGGDTVQNSSGILTDTSFILTQSSQSGTNEVGFTFTAGDISGIDHTEIVPWVKYDFSGATLDFSDSTTVSSVVSFAILGGTYDSTPSHPNVTTAATFYTNAAPQLGVGSLSIYNSYSMWAGQGLKIDGPMTWSVAGSGAGNVTVDNFNNCVIAKTAITGGGDTVTLPAPGNRDGAQVFIITDESGTAATNNIIVNVSGGALIDGQSSISIQANWGVLRVMVNSTLDGYKTW